MARTAFKKSHRRSLPINTRQKLTALIEELGVANVAERLCIHRHTLLALVAGLPGNGSTVALVEHGLAATAGEAKS